MRKAKLFWQIFIYSLSITLVVSLISGIFLLNPRSHESTKCTNYYQIDHEIVIDGNNQWRDLSNIYDWCKGSGLLSNPYIIECLIIDGNYTFDCITIKNSDVYFVIRNCIFNNVRNVSNYSYCMNVRNVSNGELLNNTIKGGYYGLSLAYCENFEIKENIFIKNSYGIESFGIENCVIKRNSFVENEEGIFWRFCVNNIIETNNFYNNTVYGIDFYDLCDNNQINSNSISLSSKGISISSSDENIISNNIVTSSKVGILNNWGLENVFQFNKLYKCGLDFNYFYDHPEYYRTIVIDTSNLVNNKPIYFYFDKMNLNEDDFLNAGQIILINCNDSFISNVNTSEGTDGIFLTHCTNISINNISSNNNSRFGINLNYCSRVNITNSIMSYNEWNGIETYMSKNLDFYYNKIENNTLSGICVQYPAIPYEGINIIHNELNKNYDGIEILKRSWEEDLDPLTIAYNELGFNRNSGINLKYCNEELIYNNSIHNNEMGIYFLRCRSNLIFQNIISNNHKGLYLTTNSTDNIIFENIFATNDIHYQFDGFSTGNILYDNIFI